MPKRREHDILNNTLSHSSILTTYNISSQLCKKAGGTISGSNGHKSVY